MITPSLVVISLICLVWFLYELVMAWKLGRRGIWRNALVTKREWVSTGKTRNLRISVSFEMENGPIERPIGFLSWYGFRDVQAGDALQIIFHPDFSFVVPAGWRGLLARPIIAGSLALTATLMATTFSFSRSF